MLNSRDLPQVEWFDQTWVDYIPVLSDFISWESDLISLPADDNLGPPGEAFWRRPVHSNYLDNYKWIRSSRFSITNSLSLPQVKLPGDPGENATFAHANFSGLASVNDVVVSLVATLLGPATVKFASTDAGDRTSGYAFAPCPANEPTFECSLGSDSCWSFDLFSLADRGSNRIYCSITLALLTDIGVCSAPMFRIWI